MHRILHCIRCSSRPTLRSMSSSSSSASVRVVPVPALDDNYMYLVFRPGSPLAAAVDPVTPDAVLEAAKANSVTVAAVLTTHHHADHSGGNLELAARLPGLPVYGGRGDKVPGATVEVGQGDAFTVGDLKIKVLQTPCHTRGHVMYHVESEAAAPLFTGDTLFVAGCGKFFEGDAKEMHVALNENVASLPDDTLIYCGHEYTVTNLKFAKTVDPDNEAVKSKLAWALEQRKSGLPTIPSTLKEEKETNPFMRVDTAALKAFAKSDDPVDVMAAVRQAKNAFKPT